MKACIIILGVAGSGKTTVGRMLASPLACDFHDADDDHSPENRQRMRAGTALEEEDRRPWLELDRRGSPGPPQPPRPSSRRAMSDRPAIRQVDFGAGNPRTRPWQEAPSPGLIAASTPIP